MHKQWYAFKCKVWCSPEVVLKKRVFMQQISKQLTSFLLLTALLVNFTILQPA